MDRQTHIEQIRAACARANPEAFKSGNLPYRKEVTIVDVLLAMGKDGIAEDWKMVGWKREGIVRIDVGSNEAPRGSFFYDLRQDRLEDQSDSTIKFLADLLV